MSLRARVILFAASIILLVAAGLLATNWFSQKQVEERYEQSTLDSKIFLWRMIMASQMEDMGASTQALMRDRATRNALKNRDREALAENAQTSYNLLSSSGIITHLQLTDPQGNILYSSSAELAGKSDNVLIKRVIKEGKTLSGLERDNDGRLYAAVGFPMLSRGKMVGVGMFLRDLSDAVEELSLNDESEVFIVGHKGKLEYSARDDMYQSLGVELPEPGHRTLHVASFDDGYYTVTAQCIYDASSQPTGYLITAKDSTESYKAQNYFKLGSMLAIVILIGGALILLYWYLNRSLRPLQGLVGGMQSIATGDLSVQIDSSSSNDEIGQLQQAMKTMVDKLREMIGQINGASADIGSSVARMSEITEETKLGVDRQQNEIAQATTAVTEMTATAQEVSRNAQEAAGQTTQANNEATSGQRIVQQTAGTISGLAAEIEKASTVISELDADSTNIGSVLDVIKGIAEQTNLLALNAAIEAARAGEQGRGFAVVADEVRSLAGRTQQSTAEIQEMIERLQSRAKEAVAVMEQSQVQAQSSVEQATQAGESLEAIMQAVTSANDMNALIATAAEEQHAVAEEINGNIININEVAEESAAGVQQTMSASTTLSELAERLREMVGNFKT